MQQINLYSDIFNPEKILFPLTYMIATITVVITFCIFVHFYLDSQTQRVTKIAEKDKQITEEIANTVSALREHFKNFKGYPELDKKIKSLKVQLTAFEKAYQALTQKDAKTQVDFMNIFSSLKDNPIQGLWLTKILITDKVISFSGGSIEAENIPLWIEGLKHTKALSQLKLETVNIKKGEHDYLLFYVSSGSQDGMKDE